MDYSRDVRTIENSFTKGRVDHDFFYLENNYKENPKESSKFILKEISSDLSLDESSKFSLLDVGCETGSFLNFVGKTYRESILYGIDLQQELLQRLNDGPIGKRITGFQADISKNNTLPDIKADVLTMMGTIGLFDDYKKIYSNVLSMLKEDGRAYFFEPLNSYDCDTLVRSRRLNRDESWHTGWNLFSVRGIVEFLKENGYHCEYISWECPIDIPENKDEPWRSWTEKMEDGRRIIVSGIRIIYDEFLIKVWR